MTFSTIQPTLNLPNSVTLHLVRLSAFSNDACSQCIALLKAHDSIVLLDDGCYSVNHPLFSALILESNSVKIYMVETHATARAINTADKKSLELISMTKVVELTFAHKNVITWQC